MSTSSSTVIGGASPDEVIRPPSMVVPGEPSESPYSSSSTSLSTLTQAFPFSSGNPRIEETRGIMHLYREDLVAASASDLPVNSVSYTFVHRYINFFIFQLKWDIILHKWRAK